MPQEFNGEDALSVKRFELMLQSNEIGFFDSEEFEQIIEYYLEAGKMIIARKAIHLGVSQHPSSMNIKLLLAEILVFDNELKKAAAVLEELENVQPHNAEIYIQKANIFSKSDDHSTAIKWLSHALELTDDKSDVYSLLGMEYLFIEDYKKAKANFMRCLELDGEDYGALYNIIYCFDFLNERKEAIDFLNSYLNTHPYSEVAWHQVGKQYYDCKMYKQALAAFDFAIISDEYFVGAYLEKGKVLEKLGQYLEAIEQYKITLSLDDPTSFAYLRMGKCYLKLGQEELAVKFLNKTVKEDPLLDKGWITIVDYYLKRKNYRKALSHIEKAIDIDSENASYWIKYAQINSRLYLHEEAEYGYRMAIETGNIEIKTWIARADVLLKLGEIEAVISNLNHGLEFFPNNAEMEYRIAGCYYRKGDTIKGKFFLQNAVKNDPEHIIILEELFPDEYILADVQSYLKL